MRYFLALTLLLAVSGAASAAGAESDARFSIAFVGDVMLTDTPGKVIKQGRDPFAPFAAILDRAEVRVGNLECVVAATGAPDPAKIYSFRAHPRTLDVLKRHFDAVGLANNHSGDFGPLAFGEMLDRLARLGIQYFGGGRNLGEAHRPLIIERNGLRVALLAYNEFMPRSFEADYDKPGIAWSEDEQVVRDIADARYRYGADLVIPFMHWGWENERQAGARQRQLARLMIDVGADAVVGGHPHVTQDIEIYRGKPIIYSLGNFLFDGFSREANNTGWLLHMALARQGVEAWRIEVARIDAEGVPHPALRQRVTCWHAGEEDVGVCPAD